MRGSTGANHHPRPTCWPSVPTAPRQRNEPAGAGLREDDVFVASYPRSGNTWIRFLLADLATGHSADFESIDRLIPTVGHHRAAPALAAGKRLIKTHEPYRRAYGHGVYFVRDVRDVLISWYRVTRADPHDLSQLDQFVERFMTQRASPYGCWCDHIRGWQAATHQGADILIYRFEDLTTDPRAAVTEIAKFVHFDTGREQIERALARNTAPRMRELEFAGAAYLRRVAGQRSPGVTRSVTGSWRTLLRERHLRALAPALNLNAELGYPR